MAAGFLTDFNGKYKLCVTELKLDPEDTYGEHNHIGPGICEVTAGTLNYVMPDKTMVYSAGDFFFEFGGQPYSSQQGRPAGG